MYLQQSPIKQNIHLLAKVFKHLQEKVGGSSKVFQESSRLFAFVELAQKSKEDFTIFHHVENVVCIKTIIFYFKLLEK